jgi:hypothetical protein
VTALSSTDATPSTISPSQERSRDGHLRRAPRGPAELARLNVLPRFAQRVGLRLAAPLGHRLGEVREDDGEPEPQRDGQDEPGRRLAVPRERLHEEPRREDAADLHHDHDGVAELVTRIELAQRVDDGAPHDGDFEERPRVAAQAGPGEICVRRQRAAGRRGGRACGDLVRAHG